MTITEDLVEQASIDTLKALGISYLHGQVLAPEGSAPERASFGDVVLRERLEAAVTRINPSIPAQAQAEAIKQVFVTDYAISG